MIKRIIPFAFLMAVAAALSTCKTTQGGESFYISSPYLSWNKTSGGRRQDGPHAGVDFRAPKGTEVIAALDGDVVRIIRPPVGCGNGVVIAHFDYEFPSPDQDRQVLYTVYCHLSEVVDLSTAEGEYVPYVKRGQVIGYVGTSGRSGGVSHLHYEVSVAPTAHSNGDTKPTRDPMSFTDGCYDPKQQLPEGKFILTFPILCGEQLTEQ